MKDEDARNHVHHHPESMVSYFLHCAVPISGGGLVPAIVAIHLQVDGTDKTSRTRPDQTRSDQTRPDQSKQSKAKQSRSRCIVIFIPFDVDDECDDQMIGHDGPISIGCLVVGHLMIHAGGTG